MGSDDDISRGYMDKLKKAGLFGIPSIVLGLLGHVMYKQYDKMDKMVDTVIALTVKIDVLEKDREWYKGQIDRLWQSRSGVMMGLKKEQPRTYQAVAVEEKKAVEKMIEAPPPPSMNADK